MDANEVVRQNIRRLRTGRQVPYAALADLLSEAGHPIPVLGLRRIEGGERRVDVGELAAFADIFGVDVAVLFGPFDCPRCHGTPPRATHARRAARATPWRRPSTAKPRSAWTPPRGA